MRILKPLFNQIIIVVTLFIQYDFTRAQESSTKPRPPQSVFYQSIEKTSSGDEFRLITILPSSNSSHINCSLQNATFATKPGYVALSYAWGDSALQRSILLNGVNFPVTENLWEPDK